MEKFYESSSNENCIAEVGSLFCNLGRDEKVCATLSDGKDGVSIEKMKMIHHHLRSSNSWKDTLNWSTEVDYTIPHPEGDATASDTSSPGEEKLTRSVCIMCMNAVCSNTAWRVRLERVLEKPFAKIDFNVTRFSRVKIMKVKRFIYETPRSCWCFKLVVEWSGETKDIAEKSSRKYRIFVESLRDKKQVTLNVNYTAASFLEKILDLVSLGNYHPGRSKICFVS